MKIALDMMGGDFAPKECCLGVLAFLERYQDATLVLIGNKAAIEEHLVDTKGKPVTIIHTEEVIEMNEHPVKAMKEKTNSSMVVGFHLLAKGEIDAFVSAGNTGVMLVGAAHVIKPIEGILRPTIPTLVPKINGSFSLMLDVGINADCKPENLNQFGTLGSLYAQQILGIETPRVALLNIGEEEGKGNLLAQGAYPLLKENKSIHFVGNIEGRDIFKDACDVIVCDGFTGNILLKLCESLYDVVKVQRNIEDEFLARFDHKLYGGVPVLGVNKPVVVGHGISCADSFVGMLEVARKIIETGMLAKVQAML